jgi:hypothetical protein
LDGGKKEKEKKFHNLIHSLEEINSPQEILNENSNIDTKKRRQLKEVIREVNANLRQSINNR